MHSEPFDTVFLQVVRVYERGAEARGPKIIHFTIQEDLA